MADLINRDYAAQAIEAYLCSQCEYDTDRDPECIACPHLDGGEILKSVPTIEPKCGEWVETEPDEDDRKIGIEFSIKCSRCHDENSHLDFNENHEITGKHSGSQDSARTAAHT
jgi:hypothetical protein